MQPSYEVACHAETTALQHSWSIEGWPAGVFPGTPQKARYLIRRNYDELLRAGALSRVGKQIVVLGDRYGRWLQLHTCDVPNYQIAPNRPQGAEAA